MDPQTPSTPSEPAAPSPQAPPSTTDYPVSLDISYPDHQSRILALFSLPFFLARFVLLIPSMIVLYFLQIAALFAAWFNMWAILFTGHSSKSMHSFITGTLRWSTRFSAYTYGLTDKYPPFRLH